MMASNQEESQKKKNKEGFKYWNFYFIVLYLFPLGCKPVNKPNY